MLSKDGMQDTTPTIENSTEQSKAPSEGLNHLWKPGQSGNPAGRPKGARNKTTIFREAIEQELTEMLARDAGSLLKVAIDKAREGDPAMLKLLIDKMLPMRKAEDASTKKSTPSITINVGKTGDGGITIDGHAEPSNEENEDEG